MPKAPANAGQSGSPSTGEPVYLAVGMLRRPHGVRGDLLMEVYTDFPERLLVGMTLYAGDTHQPVKITRLRPHNAGLLIGLEGVKNPEEAGKFRNTVLFVFASDRPELPDGEFYYHEILGLDVFDEQERNLGVLTEILETGANDVLIVKAPDGKEILIPLIDEVMRKIDLDAGVIHVKLLPGLLDQFEDV